MQYFICVVVSLLLVSCFFKNKKWKYILLALSVILDIFVDKVSLDDCKKFLILFWVGILIEKISTKKEGTPITNVIEAPTSERWSTDTTLKMSGYIIKKCTRLLDKIIIFWEEKIITNNIVKLFISFLQVVGLAILQFVLCVIGVALAEFFQI